MSKQILIDPVTRIEGHAKITIQLDDSGAVSDARFHVTQVRGFEKLCEGRPFTEMPSLMARICGICPVSHLLASAKACDAIMAVQIPEAAVKLRHMLNMAQLVQSHALSFFYLSSPDLLLGMDSDPVKRNIFGLAAEHPDLARDGIRLRQIGQLIIEWLGKERIHPSWVVPGGVNEPLSAEYRKQILDLMPDGIAIARRTLDWFKRSLDGYNEEIRSFANFQSLFLGMVSAEGNLEHCNGNFRVLDGAGRIVADQIDPRDYAQYIGEAAEPWTFLKMPYYKPMGYPNGMYRVGPLARLNIIDGCDTPLARQEWTEFRSLERGVVLSSFHYHYARLIEILYGLEKIQEILDDPDILDKRVRAEAGPNNMEGIGAAEAPRGTLIHHYKIDENGLITWANLIIATGHNNLAMNQGVLQVARRFIQKDKITEGALNRVEAVIRAFDPCLSCSTHAFGEMPLEIQLVRSDGTVADEVRR